MAAYAEGFNILRNANIGTRPREKDAETTPLQHPEHYAYDFDLAQIAEVWRHGSVVRSWLLDLTARALAEDCEPGVHSPAACRIPAKAAGRWRRQWMKACRRRSSPPRCTAGSNRAATRTMATACCRRCASSLAATSRKRAAPDAQPYSRTIAAISRMKSSVRTPPAPETKGSRYQGQRIDDAALRTIAAQQREFPRVEAAADGGVDVLAAHRIHRAVHQHEQPALVVRLRVEALA